MSEADQQSSPTPFDASLNEALWAPPEEFLYLAYQQRGMRVRAQNFVAVMDAKDGGVAHETRMPNVGDVLHHFAGTAAARRARS
jgi:hypothetical protein